MIVSIRQLTFHTSELPARSSLLRRVYEASSWGVSIRQDTPHTSALLSILSTQIFRISFFDCLFIMNR
jgi:hypothetical protein